MNIELERRPSCIIWIGITWVAKVDAGSFWWKLVCKQIEYYVHKYQFYLIQSIYYFISMVVIFVKRFVIREKLWNEIFIAPPSSPSPIDQSQSNIKMILVGKTAINTKLAFL